MVDDARRWIVDDHLMKRVDVGEYGQAEQATAACR